MRHALSTLAAVTLSKLKIVSLIAVTAALTSFPAQAVVVNVGGQNYNVDYFVDSYNNSSARFDTATMPWWGNPDLALDFAAAVGSQLGTSQFVGYYPNAVTGGEVWVGPLFAFRVELDAANQERVTGATLCVQGSGICTDGAVTGFAFFRNVVHTFAEVSSVPEPGTLGLLGLGLAGLGLSRRRRAH